MNRNYELVVILDPELKDEEQEKLLNKIKDQIAEAEGKVLETKKWGRKELAFPISKKTAGVYYLLNFSASVSSILSLRQKLQLEDKILRFLMVIEEKGGVSPEAAKK